jgi:hypothetical protein
MLTKVEKGRLPKAKLLRLEWSPRRPYFATFRNANARVWYLGWLKVTHRAPWLERPARQLHPELIIDRAALADTEASDDG